MNAITEFATPGGNRSQEEKWCLMYLLFMLVFYLLKFVNHITAPAGDDSLLHSVSSILFALANLAFLLLVIYINYKNKVWHFMFRLLLCAFVTLFPLLFLFSTLGPAGLALWAIASLIANRKLFWVFRHYKKYTIYLVLCYAVLIVISAILFFGGFSAGSPWPAMIGLLQGLILLGMLRCICLDEIRQGKSFLEVLRILALLPASFLFFCIGLLTVIPVRFFSKESLFGEEGHDFIAMP